MNNSELSIFNNDYNSLRNEVNKFIQKLNKEELTCIYQTEEKYLNLNKIRMEELSSFIKDENNKETVKNEIYYLETIFKNKKKYTEELCEKYPDDETWQDIAKEELKEMDSLFLYLDKLKENNVINIKKRVLKKVV